MRAQGFTLIEMVVALTIVVLLAGIAGPAAWRTLNSFRHHGEHSRLLARLGELRFEAFRTGRGFVLSDDTVAERLGPIPDGWSVRVPTPISYDFIGRCSGGIVELVAGVGAEVERIQLAPGTCARVQAAGP